MSITRDTDRPLAKCGAPIADPSPALVRGSRNYGCSQSPFTNRPGATRRHIPHRVLGSAESSHLTSQSMGTPFTPLGSAHNTLARYQAFQASDVKYFIVAPGNDEFLAKTASGLNPPELLTDSRFATNSDRSRYEEELADILQAVFSQEPTQHWLILLDQFGISSSPVYDISEMAKENQGSA